MTTNAQTQNLKFDLNTVFVCIDANTYNQLFDFPIIKDVFVAKNISNKTTDDSYEGEYLIGESATIEFFKPKPTKLFGDELFYFGIEFKTRNINELPSFIQRAKAKNIIFKNDSTFVEKDGKKEIWYTFAERKSNNLAVSLLEYDKIYLQNLGFTEAEINQEMTYGDFNRKISGGREYPKKFSSISSMTIEINPVDAKELSKTFELFGFEKTGKNSYKSSDFIIKMVISKKIKKIKLAKLGLNLNEKMPNQTFKIGQSIRFTTNQQFGEIIFNQ